MSILDAALGQSPEILALRSKRSAMIASNLANADTPNYKARDIDFNAAVRAMQAEASAQSLTRTDDQHFNVGGYMPGDAPTMYRVPTQPTMDGNTVESNREHTAFMDNAIRYQASLNFLSGRLSSLVVALKGE